MTQKARSKRSKVCRNGVAAVEAAICLPVLVIIWLAASEINQLVNLKQQTQILAAMSSDRAVRTFYSFDLIEEEVKGIAESLGLEECAVTMRWSTGDIVESKVTVDFSLNSPTHSLLGISEVSSALYAYRKRDL